MKKNIITTAIALLLGIAAIAQDQKVAVFDPAGSLEDHLKEIVREEISSEIVNVRGYTVLERSLINKVLEENRFQAGGLVDDSQISEIGKRMGANLVFVTSVTVLEDRNRMGAVTKSYYISCKMIDVQTARVEKQKTTRTRRDGADELIAAVRTITGEMFRDVASASSSQTSRTNQSNQSASQQQPTAYLTERTAPQRPSNETLTVDKRTVFQGGRKLSRSEVQQLLAGTDALRLYDKGIQRNKNGNILIYSGLGVAVGAITIGAKNSDLNAITIPLLFASIPTVITGTVLKLSSKKPVRDAINMHNRGKLTANTELNFYVVPSGLGLVLNF